MVHIRKTKTWYGLMYAVVDKFKSETVDENGNSVVSEDYLPVEYRIGKNVYPAMFPLTEEGLKEAKKIQKLFKSKK